MNLKDIDLNLLVIFHQMLLHKRVSAVADALDLTQPAISNSLARLRRLLGDELFVRTSRAMEPTPFAQQLSGPVAQGLELLHGALISRDAFDPRTSAREFVIAMTDIGEMYFLPTLMEALSREAPAITIRAVRSTTVPLKENMETGQIDLAIGLLAKLDAGFLQRRLFRHRYVCLYRKGHPLDKRRSMTKEEFTSAEHVLVTATSAGHHLVDEMLMKVKAQRRFRLTVPDFLAVGHTLSRTNMIATVPELFASCIEPNFNLTHCAHPIVLPEIAIKLFWHRKCHRDAGNKWLRDMVFRLFAH